MIPDATAALKAALTDRYRIERELGAGGMATVYLAEDVKHKRKVAIKVLRDELAAALGPERFLREIETTANLRHPHILPLYDSGQAGGFLYYVMPFIDGESLRDRLCREKPLAIDDALQITREVADALGYAHTRGVIHRDIKPENILLEGGHAVVADFGIAKAVSALDGGHLTQTGLAVGTPAYMSPEQVLAESTLDGRSDLYSLGCVLFEMLTGEPPFAAATSQRTIARRLTEPPPECNAGRPEIGAHLSGAVQRVLATEPTDRPATAAEFAKSLLPAIHSTSTSASGAVRQEEGFWVAVLPFKYNGSNPDITALAEGLSEEIVTGLSRFSYLKVIARGSTSRYANEPVEMRTVGKEIGARYVMEGSLRQAGARLRAAVQLVDATSGAHLWAETYDRPFHAEELFALQDDLVPRIVSTCADHFGVLARSISDAVRGKDSGQLSPYEALMRGFGYHHRLTPVDHAEARAVLERAVERAPMNADCWAMLSWIYSHEHAHGFNPRPGSLDRALAAARRAVDLAPSNHLVHQALAVVLFFRKETEGCLSAAERALALNPFDGSNEAIFLITFTGDWERGCALIRRAMERNPHHPGWYWLVLAFNEYRQRSYREAIDTAVKANAPDVFWTNMVLAAAHGQLGDRAAAGKALKSLLAQKDDFVLSGGAMLEKWFEPEVVGHFMEGLRKAGLKVASGPGAPVPAPAPNPTQSIAVLPFANMSADPQDEFFADGITEEIINALAQLDGLHVAARTSCFAFKGKNEDLRTVGEKLGVDSVLEGSVRKAGSKLRITAQLIKVTDGYHLWSERYDREMHDVFAVQDEIAGAIASKLEVTIGVGKSGQLVHPATRNLEAYELLLKGRALLAQRGPAIVRAKEAFESALRLDPGLAEAHALLGDAFRLYAVYGMSPTAEVIPKARAAAQRALAIDPDQVEALATLSSLSAIFDWNWPECNALAERALAIDPRHVRVMVERAFVASYRRGAVPADHALAQAQFHDAIRIDPLNAWAAAVHSFGLASVKRHGEAVTEARRAIELDTAAFTGRWALVWALGAAGRDAEALEAAEPALLMSGRGSRILADAAAAHARLGNQAAAENIFQEITTRAKTGYVGWSEQGAIAASAGRLDEARTLVARGIEARESFLAFLTCPSWGPFQADSAGLAMLQGVGP